MMQIKRRWKSVTSKERWAARRRSLVTKTRATKAVWFPPKSVQSGTTAPSAATKASRTATKKTAKSATKKTTGATKKSTGATKKTTNGTKP